MKPYEGYAKGNIVEVVDGDNILATGTIVRTGSNHAAVVSEMGGTYDVPYDLLRMANHTRRAAKEIIREEEHEGRKFVLVKEESNKDGQLAVQFKVLLDDKPISESEELVTNVYDQENGWSAPDDFDENKLDLIKSTYESGFDLLVDSYANIEQSITDTQQEQAEAELETPAEPQGEPAFAPGAEPAEEPTPEGGLGGAAGAAPAAEPAPEDAGAAAGGPEAQAAPAGEPAAATAASLERPTFARSVVGSKINWTRNGLMDYLATDGQTYEVEYAVTEYADERRGYDVEFESEDMSDEMVDQEGDAIRDQVIDHAIANKKQAKTASTELLRNPQHRINPLLRQEMARKGIDSATTNDLELADALKDFDFGEPTPKN